MTEHIINVDGACRGNGQAGARGAIGVSSKYGDISERLPPTDKQTNNRAEQAAINRGLKLVPIDRSPAVIRTDSEHCEKTFGKEQRGQKWVDNGGRTDAGTIPAKWDLVQDTMEEIRCREEHGQEVEFEHVRGHRGDQGNERAHE